MNENQIVNSVRAIADELSSRGTNVGEINAGTYRRLASVNRELTQWYNVELEKTESGQRLPTAKGVAIKAIIAHLVAAIGAKATSAADKEKAIEKAVVKLPGLCDQLIAKPAPEGKGRDTVNNRMIAALDDDPRRKSFTAKEWAELLDCSTKQIERSPMWKTMKAQKESEKDRLKYRT